MSTLISHPTNSIVKSITVSDCEGSAEPDTAMQHDVRRAQSMIAADAGVQDLEVANGYYRKSSFARIWNSG
jgi:hypothetical protein